MMNRLSKVVLLSAFILSAYSSAGLAASFFFLKDGGQQVGEGVDLPGEFTVPENALGTHPPLTFRIPAPVTSQVFLEKNNECLDQGVNHVGIGANASGTSLPISSIAPNSNYILTLSVDARATSVDCASGNPVPVRIATLAGAGITDGTWNGTYDTYNPASIPEPGSLALLGLGLSALLLAGRRKAKRT